MFCKAKTVIPKVEKVLKIKKWIYLKLILNV
jgi:hypothetical protein